MPIFTVPIWDISQANCLTKKNVYNRATNPFFCSDCWLSPLFPGILYDMEDDLDLRGAAFDVRDCVLKIDAEVLLHIHV